MDKEYVGHTYNGILLSHEKNEIIPSAATWTDPEITTLNEGSWAEKDRHHMIALICAI